MGGWGDQPKQAAIDFFVMSPERSKESHRASFMQWPVLRD